ncbi:hypothetical protein RVR_4917 [Actinacidiphila reveromycinica]|uniref:Uncharacterized protein n=1 Tax=Actinacidiphila reveromycinica TaxID=659352 RepID=A0A7U3VPG9_9ACTN|nr:hypothetical protein [Streptomyces sp. SN-593]BBA98649.1 hypothetical protein RVR_4917 [Streptomyces sp. SN-593]
MNTVADPAPVLRRSAELKEDLVAFGEGRSFERFLVPLLTEAAGPEGALDEATAINVIDHFLLQYRLPDGTTVADRFVTRRTGLTDTDRQMVLAWRDPVEGLFEVRGKDGDRLLLLNLLDDLEYRTYTNAGRAAFRGVTKGGFLGARLVALAPMPGAWLVSGVMSSYPRAAAPEIAAAALELATSRPDLVFRNPEKVEQGWRSMREDRAAFAEFFGSDELVLASGVAEDRINAYYRHRQQAATAGRPLGRDRGRDTAPELPLFTLPAELADAETVGVIYDQVDGLNFYADYGSLRDLFANPDLPGRKHHQDLLRTYLREESITPLPIRRLAAAHPLTVDTVFQKLLRQPGFTWSEHGDALLRRRKPWYDETELRPGVSVIGNRLSELLRIRPR